MIYYLYLFLCTCICVKWMSCVCRCSWRPEENSPPSPAASCIRHVFITESLRSAHTVRSYSVICELVASFHTEHISDGLHVHTTKIPTMFSVIQIYPLPGVIRQHGLPPVTHFTLLGTNCRSLCRSLCSRWDTRFLFSITGPHLRFLPEVSALSHPCSPWAQGRVGEPGTQASSVSCVLPVLKHHHPFWLAGYTPNWWPNVQLCPCGRHFTLEPVQLWSTLD